MKDFRTNYLGLELDNPVIIGANNMVSNIDNVKRCEEQGAAAIVYKSLFEEQIQLERVEMQEELSEYDELHAEMITQHPNIQHSGPDEHLNHLHKTKESISIPVIASLNAVSKETWIEYAQKIEQTGVDALEMNFYAVPREMQTEGHTIEDEQIDILKSVVEKVSIPVSVKLSPFYTNPLNLISRMDETGVQGFVLFNRLFQPDINIHSKNHITPFNLSNREDNKLPLRFAGLLYDEINANICSNTGICNGDDVIKMILAGANAVEIVSTIYRNKFTQIGRILSDIGQWMNNNNYTSLDEFRGHLSKKNVKDPFIYKRAQYVDMLMKKSQDVLRNHNF